MKVLLLGPNGQLGTDIQAAVVARGQSIELELLGRDRLDVADADSLQAALADAEFDALINCTSFHKTDDVERDASTAFAINSHAVEIMAQNCNDSSKRFFHISTDYVFDGIDRAKPYAEDDRISPLNVYGASKAMGEALATIACDDLTILRVASLFGVAGASAKGGNFVETMIRVGADKGALSVVDDITMSPTATTEVAEMILDLLDAGAPAGIYHAVNSGQATWCEFASAIIERAGIDATVAPVGSDAYPTVAQRPAYSVLDNAKITGTIGREIPHWSEALDRYLRDKGHVT